jgi:hypothetical protein
MTFFWACQIKFGVKSATNTRFHRAKQNVPRGTICHNQLITNPLQHLTISGTIFATKSY